MSDATYDSNFGRHNIVATFKESYEADQAARALKQRLGRSEIQVRRADNDPAVQQAEMRDELEGMVASPVLGSAMNKTQAQGAVGGAVAIAAITVALGAIIGVIVNGAPGNEVSIGRWLITWILTPAIAGGTLGMLAGGMLKPRYAPAPKDEGTPKEANHGDHDHSRDQEPQFVVNVHTDDESEFQQALSVLKEMGADRLDRFNEDGQVLATREIGGGRSDAAGPAPGRTVAGE